MNTLTDTLDDLNRRFWDEIHPQIVARAELDQIETGNFVMSGSSAKRLGDDEAKYPPGVLEMSRFLSDKVTELVRAELFAVSHLHFSCPTKFGLMYYEAVGRHYIDVKRKYMRRESPDWVASFGCYDVETDIVLTERNMVGFRENHLQIERAYLRAFDEKRWDDAHGLLTAIEIARREAEVALRNEASNWRIDLACAKGDVAMFLGAWRRIPAEALTKMEVLFHLLEKLLYTGVIDGIAVQLSADGQRRAAREGNLQAFCDDQVRHLLKSTIIDIARWLVETAQGSATLESFRVAVARKFEASRQAALGVNPLLATLTVMYKPAWLKCD